MENVTMDSNRYLELLEYEKQLNKYINNEELFLLIDNNQYIGKLVSNTKDEVILKLMKKIESSKKYSDYLTEYINKYSKIHSEKLNKIMQHLKIN